MNTCIDMICTFYNGVGGFTAVIPIVTHIVDLLTFIINMWNGVCQSIMAAGK